MSQNTNIRNEAIKVLNRDTTFYRNGAPDQAATRRSSQFILKSEELFPEATALGYENAVELEYLGLELGAYGNYDVMGEEQRNNSVLYYPDVYLVLEMVSNVQTVLFQKLVGGDTIMSWEIHQLARLGNPVDGRLAISMTHKFGQAKILTCEPNYNTNLLMVSFSYKTLEMLTHVANHLGADVGKKSVEYSTYTTVSGTVAV